MAQEWQQKIAEAHDLKALDELRVQFLGKNGLVTQQLKALRALPPEERKTKGAEINNLRDFLTLAIEQKKILLDAQALELRLVNEKVDVTLPARPEKIGKIHPISKVIADITKYFAQIGFPV